jgi:hypothetical protein
MIMSKRYKVTLWVAVDVDAPNPKDAVDSAFDFVTKTLGVSGDESLGLREDGVLWLDVVEDVNTSPVENTGKLWYNRASAKGN